MKNRQLFRRGAMIAGIVALMLMLIGLKQLITNGTEPLAWVSLGVGVLNTALLLRVMRWEVNE